MKNEGRAAEYLDHFLDESGTKKYFEVNELLAAEKDIRERVTFEIVRKMSGAKIGSEKVTSFDPVVTLFQKNSLDQDWWFALGSFGLQWTRINSSSNDDRVFVKVHGKNEYRWYPEAKRITQCLHEAAGRLEKNEKAKSFTIVAKPAVLILSLRNKT